MSFRYQTHAAVAFGVMLCGLVLATVFGLYCLAGLVVRMALCVASCMHTAETSIMLHVAPYGFAYVSTWTSAVDAMFVNLGWHIDATMTSAQMCNPSVWNAKKLQLPAYTYTVDKRAVKRNFRVLSNVYHPDKTGPFANAHSFICLTEARDELMNGGPQPTFVKTWWGGVGRKKTVFIKDFVLFVCIFGCWSLLSKCFSASDVLRRWRRVRLPLQIDTPEHTLTRARRTTTQNAAPAHTPTRPPPTTTQNDTPEYSPTRPVRTTRPPVRFK